jgi:acylpyruvate hydrolase
VLTEGGPRVVRVDEQGGTPVMGFSDVGGLLEQSDWRSRAEHAEGNRLDLASVRYAPVVPRPAKIICAGLNYRRHIEEMGRSLPSSPTLFAKFYSALISCDDDIQLSSASEQMDWEAELAVIVGAPLRHVDEDGARAGIAGFTVLNDVTARDWQYRTSQWLQGKTLDRTTPIGPVMVTSDEFSGNSGRITCQVNGELVQEDDVRDLVFGPAELIAYISQIVTLAPGDVIATGTPGGVGHARTPARYLSEDDLVVTAIDGIGECSNLCRSHKWDA